MIETLDVLPPPTLILLLRWPFGLVDFGDDVVAVASPDTVTFFGLVLLAVLLLGGGGGDVANIDNRPPAPVPP